MSRRAWTERQVRAAVIARLVAEFEREDALDAESRMSVSTAPAPPEPIGAASGLRGGLSGTCYVEVPSSLTTVYDGRLAGTVAASMPDAMVVRVTTYTQVAGQSTGTSYDTHLDRRRAIIRALATVDDDAGERLPVQSVRAAEEVQQGMAKTVIEAALIVRAPIDAS